MEYFLPSKQMPAETMRTARLHTRHSLLNIILTQALEHRRARESIAAGMGPATKATLSSLKRLLSCVNAGGTLGI